MSPIAKHKITMIAFVTAFTLLYGCGSSPNKQAIMNPDTGKHPANWLVDHRAAFLTSAGSSCTECHGADLKGGISGVSCFSATFNGISCHANGPSGHPVGWSSPDSHGASAKSAPDAATTMGFSTCQTCHDADFTGGLASRTCLNTAGCHGAGVNAPHPSSWLPTSTRKHNTTNAANAPVCGLCHLNGRTPPSYISLPAGSQPGCFNNALCHGSNAAPHPVPFTDPALHGPLAKSDLTYCEGCHATPSNGGPGSNPRFNVAKGSLVNGCEDCHSANTAHPTQWRGLTTTAPGGHMTAGNMANACALCHGATFGGGVGPACSTCHTAGSPLTLTNCTSCHGNPPTGTSSPNRAGAHATHNGLPNVTNVCNTCHNGGGTGTANHDYGSSSPFLSFLTAYNAKSGGTATYNTANNTCSTVSCHGGQTTPIWLTGAIDVNTQCTVCHAFGTTQYNSYNSGQHDRHVNNEGFSCQTCHDTTLLAVNHFTTLNTSAMEGPASATLRTQLQYNGSSCNPQAGGLTGCHGSHNWR